MSAQVFPSSEVLFTFPLLLNSTSLGFDLLSVDVQSDGAELVWKEMMKYFGKNKRDSGRLLHRRVKRRGFQIYERPKKEKKKKEI
jgi:hypothetical protein